MNLLLKSVTSRIGILSVQNDIFLHAVLILSTNSQNLRGDVRNFRELPTESLTLADSPSYYLLEPNGPGTYAFGYEVDDSSGNVQFRDEEKLSNGTIRGSYGYLRPDGLISLTRYIADGNGYRSETQTFKRGEKPPANKDIPHPLDHSVNKEKGMSSDEMKKMSSQSNKIESSNNENNEKPDVTTIIDGVQPVAVMSKDGKSRYSVQLFNNFVPANFPIVTFNQAEKDLKGPTSSNSNNNDIGHDFVDFTNNDKFHNPLIDGNLKMLMLKQMTKNADDDMIPMADTKEALWYKELIRNRRREFLKRYGHQGKV